MRDDGVARSGLDTELWGAYDWRGMPAGGIYPSLVCTSGRSIPLGGVSSELHILGIFVPQNEGCFVPISQDRYLHL